MYGYDTREFDREIRAEKTRNNKKGEMSATMYKLNAWGSADPYSTTMNAIYDAYNEYKMNLEW